MFSPQSALAGALSGNCGGSFFFDSKTDLKGRDQCPADAADDDVPFAGQPSLGDHRQQGSRYPWRDIRLSPPHAYGKGGKDRYEGKVQGKPLRLDHQGAQLMAQQGAHGPDAAQADAAAQQKTGRGAAIAIGRHGDRPVFIGDQMHDPGLLDQGFPLEQRVQRSTDEQVAHVDDQYGQGHLHHGQGRRPHLHHDKLGGAGKNGQVHRQQLQPR